jgi:DedD protein
MEVKGDEFLKNLEIEKEKAELEKRKSELNSQKFQSVYQQANSPLSSISSDMDTDYQELDDIRLNKNANNKQKYIVFGLALVLLFLITILTIRLISEPQKNNNFTNEDILKEEPKEIVQKTSTPTNMNKSLDINKIIQSEDNINVQQDEKVVKENKIEKESDVFGIEKKPQEETKKDIVIKKDETVVKKEKPKQMIIESVPVKEIKLEETKTKIAPKPILKETKKQKVSAVKGYYIQVGAFTKYPDTNLLNKLKINGYRVTMHKMEIKGKMYTKVLIGSYKSKAEANSNLPFIKQRINKSAYILRF